MTKSHFLFEHAFELFNRLKAITSVQFTVVQTIVKSRLVVDQTTFYNREFILKPRLFMKIKQGLPIETGVLINGISS